MSYVYPWGTGFLDPFVTPSIIYREWNEAVS